MTDGPYTHSSVTGKMAGTSDIPDFLAHWHTSGKLCFQTRVQIYMYYSVSVWKLVNQIRWLEASRHWCVVGWHWNHVPGQMHLVPASGYPNCEYCCLCTCIIPHPWSLLRCPSKDVSGQTTIFGWLYGYGNLLEQVWKTSIWHLMEQLWYRK